MSYDFPAHESTRKRRRWGCTCGCVVILIILALGSIGVSYFGLKSNPPFTRYAMMDNSVDGFGVLRLNAEDQGVSEFTNFVAKRLEKSQKQASDPSRAKAIGLLTKIFKNVLTKLFQAETMIYTNYHPETADENVLAAIPLNNLFSRGIIETYIQSNVAPKPDTTHGPAAVYSMAAPANSSSTGTLISIDNNKLVVSDNQALLFKSLDYAADANHNVQPAPDLDRLINELNLDEPTPGEDLSVALVNEESRITNMISVFEQWIGLSGLSDRVGAALASQKLTFADITGMKLTADLASADLLKGELTLYCPQRETATRLAKVLQDALPSVTGKNERTPFELKGTASAREALVVVSLELSGLKAWIEKLIPVEEPSAPTSEEPAAAPATAPAPPAQ